MRFLAILIPILAVFGADLPVEQWPLPDGALQPRVAVDGQGVVHAVWLRGDPQSSEVWYAQRSADAGSWMPAVRVDRGAGSAVAMGTVRGVHIALDGKDRAHLLWLGSAKAEPKSEDGSAPMLYSRAGESGFSVPLNIIERGVGVDGGSAVAADDEGRVWVFWHARAGASEDAKRVVIFWRSTDAGATFGREQSAANRPTGACACCGMAAMADGSGGQRGPLRDPSAGECGRKSGARNCPQSVANHFLPHVHRHRRAQRQTYAGGVGNRRSGVVDRHHRRPPRYVHRRTRRGARAQASIRGSGRERTALPRLGRRIGME